MKKIYSDIMGGLVATLVALPSAIAFGLIIYSPLGQEYFTIATISGIMGTILLGTIASLLGGTIGMISAPCAPAAAVISAFIKEINSKNLIPPELIPVYLMVVIFFTGLFQLFIGKLGGGRIIKFIPYPVIAGYLSGVGILIFVGQIPKFLGLPKDLDLLSGILSPSDWNQISLVIGTTTILTMLFSSKFSKRIPAVIIAFCFGIGMLFLIGFFDSTILNLENNPLIIGKISASMSDVKNLIQFNWSQIFKIEFKILEYLILPIFTLGILLSIDTLKTSVLLDVILSKRHDSNKELVAQGLGNIVTSFFCGIPGGGTTGPTLINVNSGGRKFSGVFMGIFSLLVLLLFGPLLALIPISALAGVLIVIGFRMIDFKSFTLLKNPQTRFDFFVIFSVVISAFFFGLVSAAGVGTVFAILLFLRDQIYNSVVYKKFSGTQYYSKKRRLNYELDILARRENDVAIFELQGPLFFGTTDQLFTVLVPYLKNTKYIILSFRKIKSIDFTAVNLLKQIHKQIKDYNGTLIISSIPSNLIPYLKSLGLDAFGNTENLKFFIELDKAKEWVEEIFLSEEDKDRKNEEIPLKLRDFEFFQGFDEEIINKFRAAIKSISYPANSRVCEMGQVDDEIFFIRKGEINIYLPFSQDNGKFIHLATFCRGDFFGEMSFLDNQKRSAHAIVEKETLVYVLSRKEFDKVTKNYPEVSSKFFERLAFAISFRLRLNHSELIAREE